MILNKTLNIAVIGCGYWGKNHIRVLSELGSLYAVSDLNFDTANPFANQYQVLPLSLEQILNDSKIDGVVIATPAHTHHALGLACLNANKHVFIEKPITLSVEEAVHLAQEAKFAKKVLMAGHLLHYHPAFAKLKQLCAFGELGEIQSIQANRLSLGRGSTERNVWWSYAPHDMSMILSLIHSMPEKIVAHQAQYLESTQSDSAHVHLSFPGGTHAHLFASWLHPVKEQKFTVIGNKAMAIFDDLQPWSSKLMLYPFPEGWWHGLPLPAPSVGTPIDLIPSEPLTEEVKHFMTCIKEEIEPLTNGQEAVRVMKVMKDAETAMKLYSEAKRYLKID